MEQMCLDFEVSEERRAFNLVYPELSDLIYNAPIDSGVLIFKELQNLSSVYFLSPNKLFLQIRLRKKSRYLLIPESYASELPEDVVTKGTKSEEGMVRVVLNGAEDIVTYAPVLRKILQSITRGYHEFACCSRYEECSDALTCIHPNPKFALGCKYRQNLDLGKVFYGKNKNI